MTNNQKTGAVRWLAVLLALTCLFALVGCGNQQSQPTETTGAPAQTTAPKETEAHTHSFVDGVCQCGEENGFAGVTVETAAGLAEVAAEAGENGLTLTSANPAGEAQSIRLTKELDGWFGRYYELVYRFTSDVAGTVRFQSEGAAYYETNEYEVKAGENELVVRFAAGKDSGGKISAALELGALDKFTLTFSAIECKELTSDLNPFFLDVADQATGSMVKNGDGHLAATYKANEGWRVKLAVDRTLVKGKTYETTFVFTKEGGKAQNVTYTVYDGAATILGSKTKWVEGDVCVATFYLTANENVTKGTCLELGQLCDGTDVKLTFTYVDFVEVDEEKLAKLQAENPFPGVNVWTEGALVPAEGSQSAEGLKLTNPNAAADWWKVKLEKELQTKKGSYYRIKFAFTSNAEGRIKFVNDAATYFGTNEYDVKKGENVFAVEFQSGGNSYSCLELGGLGKCELLFTEITVEEIEKPQTPAAQKPTANRFSSFNVWADGSVTKPTRKDTATTLTLTSKNAPTDWWKIKLEKDINGKAGKCYEVTYTFTSDAAGRIKFVNDDANYFTSNEYDVVVGENTFKVQFKYGGKPYSCLELGSLGNCKLVFKNYTIKAIEEPEVTTNGFENYKPWTEASMKPLVREDDETSMTLISENAPTDWWKVKLETNFALEAGKTYEAKFVFTSNATGDMKFGTNENVTCHTGDVHAVVEGENTFTVTFTAAEGAYTCLELGGLGEFRLTFTEISLTETEAPTPPPEHEHSFVSGTCDCGETNGFEGFKTWNEGALTPVVRQDTATTMTLISENASGDWWKVKLENNFATLSGKTYQATYTFTSNAEGDIKFGGDNMNCTTPDVYHVVAGENTFTVTFTVSADNAYNCLELGGLGQFELVFSSITLKEEGQEPEHEHSFVNGTCDCGETNGFEGFKTWNEGALTPVVRQDTATTMTLISENASGDWWKVKLENNFATLSGKTYQATYTFTSNAEGDIKFGGDNMNCTTSDVYHVVAGENTFAVTFTVSADNAYNCLELGGLGQFELVFSSITLEEEGQEPDHEHSFVNGTCDCGETNGFEGFKTWNEGTLTPVVRQDTATTMTLISENASGDWWKVKLENNFATLSGKTYQVTYTFTSNAEGDIKFGGDNMNCTTSDVYHVVAGENTFAVTFTVSADNAYNCLELGGLGQFQLVFSGIGIQELS